MSTVCQCVCHGSIRFSLYCNYRQDRNLAFRRTFYLGLSEVITHYTYQGVYTRNFRNVR
jgi:hypothetical protein